VLKHLDFDLNQGVAVSTEGYYNCYYYI
jgi:hypothetical protein